MDLVFFSNLIKTDHIPSYRCPKAAHTERHAFKSQPGGHACCTQVTLVDNKLTSNQCGTLPCSSPFQTGEGRGWRVYGKRGVVLQSAAVLHPTALAQQEWLRLSSLSWAIIKLVSCPLHFLSPVPLAQHEPKGHILCGTLAREGDNISLASLHCVHLQDRRVMHSAGQERLEL